MFLVDLGAGWIKSYWICKVCAQEHDGGDKSYGPANNGLGPYDEIHIAQNGGTWTYSEENDKDSWSKDECIHCKKETLNYWYETGNLGGGGRKSISEERKVLGEAQLGGVYTLV